MKKTMCREIDLMEHIPFFMKEVQEFRQIVKVENPEFDLLQDTAMDMMNNQFIKDSTEYGVRRWEKILGILPNKKDTLNERKSNILTILNTHVPYTMRVLKQMLGEICGEDNFLIDYDEQNFVLTIEIRPLTDSQLRILIDLLKNMIPANIVFYLKIVETEELLTEDEEVLLTEDGEILLAERLIENMCF